MGIRLSDMQAVEARATATWQHETVEFAYRPGVVTLDWLDAMTAAMESDAKALQEAADGDDKAAATARVALAGPARMLAGVLVWWDVLDDDKQRVPVTEEFLRQVPLTFHQALLDGIREDNANPPA